MGYTLRIGQAVLDWHPEVIRVSVEPVTLDYAPAFGEPTDHTNARWPSYTSWHDFCQKLGIIGIMFGQRNGYKHEIEADTPEDLPALLADHPGVSPVSRGHVEFIEKKINEYKAKHPRHIAQLPPLRKGVEDKGMFNSESDLVDDPKYDATLCRAEWLIFWLLWAVDNCSYPTFYNS